MKKKKIGIIGAGWFGCYIGYDLIKTGYDVTIFEKKEEIFQGASGLNQNRLHQGFHYPRSYNTIKESKIGYINFAKKFPKFVKSINKNLYVVANDKNNKIDFDIYKQILNSNKLLFKEEQNRYKLKNFSGIISCKEKLIDTNSAKKFFINNLSKNIKKNYLVRSIKEKNNKIMINNLEFDRVVNCTWQTAFATKKLKFTYEACLFFLYKSKKKNHPAITVMDGPFTTLYPQEKRYFTLYSVKYTRLKQFKNFKICEKYLKKLNNTKIIMKSRKYHENQIKKFYPGFLKNFEYQKPLITYRTIVDNANAERSSKIFLDGKIINLLSGKIDHIIQCSNEIKKCLKKF
ncbi:MAG: hypothetical protein CMA12_00515 [Euryarchaeota archaeon]|nr:hypothetical protein [Euryarchaeota archaeon]